MFAAFALIGTCIPASTAPLQLKFTAGEHLRYAATISFEDVRGPGKLAMTGRHIMDIQVTSVNGGRSKMKVSYSGISTSAKVSGAAMPADQKSKLEKDSAEGLKRSLGGPGRTQDVEPNGRTTYHLKNGNKTVDIEEGAFLMTRLPAGGIKLNQKWTVKLAFPEPNASKPISTTYKFVGITKEKGEQGCKFTFSASDGKTQTVQQGTVKARLQLTGFVVVGSTSGKVLYGEFVRKIETTFTSKATEKTPSQTVSSTTTVKQTVKKM